MLGVRAEGGVVVGFEGEDEGGGTGTTAMIEEEADVVVDKEVGLGIGEAEGDAVTVGVMTTVDVELIAPINTFKPSQLFPSVLILPVKGRVHSQPISTHAYPGIQQPPPGLFGQLVYPASHVVTLPEHVCPCPQHPTSPSPVSVISSHVSPFAQQLFGRPTLWQVDVPAGH